MWDRWTLLSAVVVVIYVFLCPYTKVEESFNMQAVHDIMVYGNDIDQYDHLIFSGVVPRTFIGPLLLAGPSQVVAWVVRMVATLLGSPFSIHDNHFLIFVVRSVLGLSTVAAVSTLRRALVHRSPNLSRHRDFYPNWYREPKLHAAFTAVWLCSFHSVFYASRPLANTFATIGTSLAAACFLRTHLKSGVSLLATTTIVFRCDVFVLALPLIIAAVLDPVVWCKYNSAHSLSPPANASAGKATAPLRSETGLKNRKPKQENPRQSQLQSTTQDSTKDTPSYDTWRRIFLDVITAGLLSSITAIGCTIMIDSWFWKRWVWPELDVLRFNTYENKSSEWGVSPPLWYFYSVLPRALTVSNLFVLASFVRFDTWQLDYTQPHFRLLAIPCFVFISLYSLLPHKELRFVMPCFPLLACTAAVGLCKLYFLLAVSPRPLLRVLWYGVCLSMVGSAVLSIAMLGLSSINYPGGYAMKILHEAYNNTTLSHPAAGRPWVHIDNLAATTGVCRFGERRDLFRYSKEERLNAEDYQKRPFSVLINAQSQVPGFDPTHSIRAFSGRLSLANLQSVALHLHSRH